ncbi:piggyBac transposable element-derived protein 4 isoform X1 [Colletes latitarsis]|uniref:piggyBac transposable element-derived protein 4 isoform X1 n=1 Tax=Colletes latitarsis TaxID=2605962 RepID=UPI0040350F10
MPSKRKTSNIIEDSNYDSDDSEVIIFKRRRINVIDDSVSDNNIPNTGDISKYIMVTENEYIDQGNLFQFIEMSGPRCRLSNRAKPIEYFNLFFTNSLWAMMVEETNKYAEEILSKSTRTDNSRMVNWYPVTILELKAFVAVLLEMGITNRPTIYSYWTESSRAIPWFKKMFSRNRFQNILRWFHIVDNKKCFPPGHEKYDPCAKFNPIVEHANRIFQTYYTLHKMLSIDESLVGTLYHSSITQYLPNKKHHKWGIKFWMLCDAISKYCVAFYCYKGAQSKNSQNGLGYDVVTKLLQDADCLDKGYHVYVDNYFTSTALAKFLHSKNTYITGTIRRNRKDIPKEAKELKVGETKYFRNVEVLLCAHREKKSSKNPVLLISTEALAANVTLIQNRYGRERQKTKPYNNYMGGVDESDKMLYTYLDERRTVKYWKKVTFNIFTRMVLNSYLLYKETVGREAMSRLQYISNIISEIEHEWLGTRENELNIKGKKVYGLEKLPGRNLRRCVVCSTKNSTIKRSRLICVECKKGLHALCFDKHICAF